MKRIFRALAFFSLLSYSQGRRTPMETALTIHLSVIINGTPINYMVITSLHQDSVRGGIITYF